MVASEMVETPPFSRHLADMAIGLYMLCELLSGANIKAESILVSYS